MNDEISAGIQEASEERICNDDRFIAIFANARELRELIGRLNHITGLKVEELLGTLPSDPTACVDSKQMSHPSWIDKVIYEQNESLRVISSTLDLVERV